MEAIDIHVADEAECEQAARLLAESEPWVTLGLTLDKCRKICSNNAFMLYTAYVQHQPSGFIIIDPGGVAGSPYVKSIAVYPEFRGREIGTALLSYTENLFRGKARYIFLCVSSFNNRAQRFYLKCGYQPACEFKDYIIDGESEILMQKKL